jgi:hypothetical protein
MDDVQRDEDEDEDEDEDKDKDNDGDDEDGDDEDATDDLGTLWAHPRVVYSNRETMYNFRKKYYNYLCPFLLSFLAI